MGNVVAFGSTGVDKIYLYLDIQYSTKLIISSRMLIVIFYIDLNPEPPLWGGNQRVPLEISWVTNPLF